MSRKLFLKKGKHPSCNIQNLAYAIALIVILAIGSYYRLLAIDSNVRIRNGFESSVSMASYLFVNPAAYHRANVIKEEHRIYDSFPLNEYNEYTDGAEDVVFVRNHPGITKESKDAMHKSRSELGWAFILRYVLPDGIKGSQNMAKRLVRFRFIIEMILIILLFFIGKKVAGFLGAVLSALLYAIFLPAVHMMCYITYYYWAIPFSVFSLFFWVVLYDMVKKKNNLKKKLVLFFIYGMIMGLATATRMVFLLLPLFLSPFIFYKERKIKISIILLIVMLSGQFLLLIPQVFVNRLQFGRWAISTRETWHAVFMGVGMRKNPFGIENSGDYAVFDYIKRTQGIDFNEDGFDAYNKACKEQAIKIIKENPRFFINNSIKNIKTGRRINPTVFYGIDTPFNKATAISDIQKSSERISERFREKYFLWLILLALIISRLGSQAMFRMFLLVIAQNIYLVLVICLYFPNYLYYMSGYIPSWIFLLSCSLAIVLRQLLLCVKSLTLAGIRVSRKMI
ncbi:MAG: hypothetical protein U9Q21_00485 [Candidatus Auribacterota bacterium]|nr:hypothetical protein [Candidatus Auribacterota bacterium]